jgi:hypothetical protein
VAGVRQDDRTRPSPYWMLCVRCLRGELPSVRRAGEEDDRDTSLGTGFTGTPQEGREVPRGEIRWRDTREGTMDPANLLTG